MKKYLRIAITTLLLLFCTIPVYASNEESTPKHAMLSFDDGPSGKITTALLDLLKEEQVPATFFLCGYRIDAYPELVERIAAEGHTIGTHGYSHEYLSKSSPEQIRQELTDSIQLIEEITGKKVQLFRPPGGLSSADVVAEAEKAGVSIALWDVDPEDWKGGSAEKIAASVLRQAHSDCVILLHDLNMQTVYATKTIIHALREQGYEFTTMG